MPGDVFLLKKALRIVKEKAKILCLIGILLGAALGCQAAGEYLHETYLKEESVSTSGAVSEKKTVVIDSGHGGKDREKSVSMEHRRKSSICRSQRSSKHIWKSMELQSL